MKSLSDKVAHLKAIAALLAGIVADIERSIGIPADSPTEGLTKERIIKLPSGKRSHARGVPKRSYAERLKIYDKLMREHPEILTKGCPLCGKRRPASGIDSRDDYHWLSNFIQHLAKGCPAGMDHELYWPKGDKRNIQGPCWHKTSGVLYADRRDLLIDYAVELLGSRRS